jgi:YVTN family beta-propeller protein
MFGFSSPQVATMTQPFAFQRSRLFVAALVLSLVAIVGTPSAALAQDGYVTLRSTNQALAYDPADPTVVSNTINLPGAPTGLAMSPDGTTAYVVVGNAIYRIVNGVLDATALATGLQGQPEQLALSPDGTTLFAVNPFGNSKVEIVDVGSGGITNKNFTGAGMWGIDAVTTPAGDRVYVAMSALDQVAVLDMAGNTLTTVSVGDTPRGVAASPLGDRVYVANDVDGSLTVIDTATDTAVTIPGIGNNPEGVAVSADGNLVYVTLRGDGDVAVIDTTTNTLVDTVDLGTAGDALHGISFSADGSFVVVAHFGTGKISVIDPSNSNSFVTTGPISGAQPRYVDYTPLAPVFPDTAPLFNLPLCGAELNAVLDTELSIPLSVIDDNGVMVSLSQTPATGGELDPALPSSPSTTVETSFVWTPGGDDAGDYDLEFSADDGVNPPVSCAVTVHVPEPPEPPAEDETEFAAFRLRLAKISTRGYFADSFWFNGYFNVDLDSGDDVAPGQEDVTINIEGAEWIIPAGEFAGRLHGRLFLYRGVIDGTRLLVSISPRGRPGKGRYNINVSGWKGDLDGADNPLQMCVTIGDDTGCAERRGWIR